MRIVVALGGNALLKRGEPQTVANERRNVEVAVEALSPLAEEHELVISHGNGPQVGLLALQAAAYKEVEPYPLDVLGAQTEGMLGYLIEQELRNRLGKDRPVATVLTMVEVDPNDPAFGRPTKPIGPLLTEEEARALERHWGYAVAPDGDAWRRVVPSPFPKHVLELRPIRWLLERGAIVVCTGGGGIPTIYDAEGRLRGAEVVIDKDYASALLARELEAELYVMATDVDAVYLDWGTSRARALGSVSYDELQKHRFPEGSMGPKVAAACWFAESTGRTAGIGALADVAKIVAGEAGTRVHPTGSAREVFGLPVR